MFGHPKGLFVLFFTELWERFSYYGMRAILVLYMVSKTENGGLGWDNADALMLYGWYGMLVYVMSVPGGIIADKVLGQRKSVMIGGALLCAGHALMAYTAMWAFYTALALIILGVGMLKPNISTMVGGLYDQNDPRKDAGFTIFYMGINVGAFLSGLIVGTIGEMIGWHYGFALAGIGMLAGQIVYIWGQKHLGDAGLLKPKDSSDKKNARGIGAPEIVKFIVAPFAITFVLFYAFAPTFWFVSMIVGLFGYIAAIHHSLEKQIEKDRLKVLAISFIIVMVFWAAFEQAGGLMNLYTYEFTDRNLLGFEIPASVFQSLNPFFIITLAPVMAWIWIVLAKRKKEPSAIYKMGLGTVILGIGFLFMVGASIQRGELSQAKSSMLWLVFAYLFHTIGELALSPVSLSFITKMAPAALGSSLMGIYFAVTGFSNKLAASVGAMADKLGEKAVFGGIALFTVFMGILLIYLTKRINALAHEEAFDKNGND